VEGTGPGDAAAADLPNSTPQAEGLPSSWSRRRTASLGPSVFTRSCKMSAWSTTTSMGCFRTSDYTTTARSRWKSPSSRTTTSQPFANPFTP